MNTKFNRLAAALILATTGISWVQLVHVGLLTLILVRSANAGAVSTTLHSFNFITNGCNPSAELVAGSDGNFYGTTSGGGTNGGRGTVFKISTNGTLSSVYSFNFSIGAAPNRLVQGTDGNFYGTTVGGGPSGSQGTVFKISTNGSLSILHSFSSYDAVSPLGGLVLDSDGNFYGTTYGYCYGCTNFNGTVFRISSDGTFSSLYSFNGGDDGGQPEGGLVRGSDGNFYGTTSAGGSDSHGTVFKISSTGTLASLYSFCGTNDGGDPEAGLVQGSDGNFYGTTFGGGTSGSGTVFKISSNGALTSLYSFTGGNDGANPQAGLVQGSDGNFYGTTSGGGTSGNGTVFRITTNGTLTSLYSFTGGSDGANPQAGLVQGSDGNLYGTSCGAPVGGTNGWLGAVFVISTSGTFRSLYSFTGGNDGTYPDAGLVQASDGNFYGTTFGGGTNGNGTVFRVTSSGTYGSLYSFTGGNDGANPQAVLVQGNDGNLYGTTSGGGTSGSGTVFRISSNGALTSLYSFTGGNDGKFPTAGLVQGSDGNLYGTTSSGGTNTSGTVFRISTNGTFSGLYSFTGGGDGANPRAELVQGSDGNLYGTTDGGGTNDNGTVFKISTAGTFHNLYVFNATPGNAIGPSGLVQGRDGNFYGTTYRGGTNGSGTVFTISTDGTFRSLYSFSGGNDGSYPGAGLVQGSDGDFYGTTSWGPANLNGVNLNGAVFKISTNGTLTSLYSFSDDGANPSRLVQGRDGNFYGTSSDGAGGFGAVFRLTVVPAAPLFQAVKFTQGALDLIWSTEPGASYQLQSNSELSSTNWTNLGSPLIATSTTLGFRDYVTNGPARFYRAVRLGAGH